MTERAQILKELDRETEYYSDHTRRQYFGHVVDYLDYVDSIGADWRDRDVVYDYEKKLKKKGHSQSHINYLMRGPVGCLFRAHGLRLPVKLPRTRVALLDLTHRVSFPPDQIISLIEAARDSNNKVWQFLMAVATTYGKRATEIRTIRREDVHPKKRTIFVHTLKDGIDGEHLVPPQIEKYIFGYDYPLISANRIYDIFTDICHEAGLERIPRKGYHAIRHGLASELVYVKKVDQTTVFKFLRWRGGTMLNIYATPYMPDIDELIFKNHPFLKTWGK